MGTSYNLSQHFGHFLQCPLGKEVRGRDKWRIRVRAYREGVMGYMVGDGGYMGSAWGEGCTRGGD